MGKIKKLQDKGATILPLTVADAVLMNSTEAGNLSTYLEALKSDVDFLLSIIGEDQAGDIFLKTKDGMPRGFYTDGFVSAGGKSTTEGGGGGGANLSQMWESLQTNNDTFKDSLINVAHIPTLTTGKISDFVSATQAIANTAVANKADKATTLAGYGITDAVKKATKSANASESCVGYTTADHNLQNGGLFTGLGADGLYGSQLLGNYVGTALYYRGKKNGTWTDWKTVAFTDSNVASAQKLAHSNGKVGAIVAEDGRLEKVAFLYNIYGVGVKIAQGTVPTSVGDLSPAVVFGLQDAIKSSYGTAIWGTSDGKGHIQVGRLDKTATAYSLCLQEFGGNVGIGTVAPTAKLHVNGDSIIDGKLTVATGALKIVDANLSYDLGTLIVDKSLKAIGTMSATQGEFANYIKIGNATISWNPKGYLEINEGLASHKFISAGGVVTGDAGGGGGGLSLTDMWVSLNGNIDAYGKSKIHIDHIPLDVILSHDSYENDVASRINTFNYSNSTSFTSAVKELIVADNIPTLEMSKIEGLETTLTNIGTVVQSNYETLNTLITNNHNDHEARIKAIEQALTWQTV